MKRKEEQDERLATLKNYQAKLNKQRAASQATIDGQLNDLEKINA